ncbi:MAG: hypothetical protein U0441_27640 [Polyangiaceae bacterium]
MSRDRRAGFILSEEDLCALGREHVGRFHGVHIAPDIPPKKLQRAREEHRAHLPPGEPVAILFDATTLGGARDGFVVTPLRVCWKEFLEHPRQLTWEDLAGVDIFAEARHVSVAHGQLPAPWVQGGPDAVCDLLLALRKQRRGGMPYRDVAHAEAPITLAERILRAARRHLGERGWIHYRPSIPRRMLEAARAIHAGRIEDERDVLVLYDDTVFGSGADGLVLTERAVCWRSFLGDAEAIRWDDLDVTRIVVDGDLLYLDGERRVDLRMRPGMARLVARAVEDIAAEVERAIGEGVGAGAT